MSRNKKNIIFIAVLLFFAACSTQNHFHTLSFFFDGVPNPNDVEVTNITDSLQPTQSVTSSSLTQVDKTTVFIHKPYLDKECSSCHNQGRMGSLHYNRSSLCYQCHDNLESGINYLHGPVAAGYCMECHNPHKSKEEKLLVRKVDELCTYCHLTSNISKSVYHNSLKNTTCISCHDPHGSENHSLLQQGTCYGCHDDFSEKYSVVHGPVSSGQCSVCHIPHISDSEHLLAKSGRDLCFNCHDALRLLNENNHSYIGDTSCMECHNAHGGEDRYMFY